MTLGELIETYNQILENKTEEFKMMAKANGAEIKEEEDSTAFQNVINQVKERKGVTDDKTPERKAGIFKINQI